MQHRNVATSAARENGVAFLLPLFIVCVAVAARGWQLRGSLWLDELHTSWTVAGDWSQVAPRARAGNQSPLFFYLTWLTVRAVGESEVTLRLSSFLAGAALVWGVFALVRRWGNCNIAASAAALLAACDPILIFYSQEARPYASIQLLALVHCFALWRLLKNEALGSHCWRIVWIATGAAIAHFHITGATVFAADAAVLAMLFLRSPSRNSKFWRARHADWLLTAMLVASALIGASHVFERRAQWAEMLMTPSQLFRALNLPIYVLLPMLAVCGATVGHIIAARRSQAFAANVVSEQSESIIQRFEHWLASDEAPPLQIALAWLLAPIVFAWCVTQGNVAPLFSLRFLNVIAAAPAVIAGLLVASLPSRYGKLGTASVLLATLILHVGYVARLAGDGVLLVDRQEKWRDAISQMNERPEFGSLPIVCHAGLFEERELDAGASRELREYCLFPLLGLYQLRREPELLHPIPPDVSETQLGDSLLVQITTAGGAWMIVRGDQEYARRQQQHLQQALQAKEIAVKQVEAASFGELQLVRLMRIGTLEE